jgi:hypothetical protein
MKFNKWTMGLAAVGVVSLASAARADEQKSPMSQVATAVNGTTISGSVDFAASWRPGTDQGGGSDYYYYDEHPNIPSYSYAKNDGFSLNAVDIVVQKAQDESPWASGYYVEMMYGSDAVGVPLTSNSYYYDSARSAVSPYGYYSSPVYGFAVRQAYIALRTPVGNSGIDWKVGVFDTIIGYESSTDALNPNYTRSYGYTYEPTTHTGILATYKVNDMVTLSAGVANSSLPQMPSFTPTATYESQKAYMGSVALTAPDSMGFMKGATLTLGVVNSTDSMYWANGSATSYYAGATIPTPLTALKVGAAFDLYDHHDRYNTGPYAYDQNPSDDSVWVAALYANYQINDKASVNLRGEYVRNDGEGSYYNNDQTVNAEEVTATLQYNLWANVLSRVEFRWDHVEKGKQFGYSQNGYSDYYGYPNKEDDFLLALNLIYQF